MAFLGNFAAGIRNGRGSGGVYVRADIHYLKKEWYTHDRDVLDVPDVLPLPGLIERLNTIIAEEHLKWMIFTKSVDVIALDDKDMTAFSGIRDDTWKEKKKLFGL